jgi:CYTH domain-containing protein
MGYDIDVVRYYMSFSNMGKYWEIDYVNGDMKLKSYAEVDKTGNDLEDRKAYIEYYNRTKKTNEFRAKARMYNAYCASHFIEKKMVSDI